MKRYQLLIALFVAGVSIAQAQSDATIDAAERKRTVDDLAERFIATYVFPDIAKSAAEALRSDLAAGAYDRFTDAEPFAEALTATLQRVTKDKHVRVRPRPTGRIGDQGDWVTQRTRSAEAERAANRGFRRVEILDGNIGYLDLRGFAPIESAREQATAAMHLLANSDAIIFDLRRNGGGSPSMIQYLLSYLIETPTHFNSFYQRNDDTTVHWYTLAEVPGRRMAEIPVVVLTSDYTFSAAEEFTYDIQNLRRGTIVGDTTGGGANPGGVVPVGARFAAFIPNGRAINPVTGTNWEGVGVIPDVAVEGTAAYDSALAIAARQAGERRDRLAERNRSIYERIQKWRNVGDAHSPTGDRADAAGLRAALDDARRAGVMDEVEINMLGYQMMAEKNLPGAIALFRYNVETYPDSWNVYDSLGEALAEAGERDQAIANYRRSIELNPNNSGGRRMLERLTAGK